MAACGFAGGDADCGMPIASRVIGARPSPSEWRRILSSLNSHYQRAAAYGMRGGWRN